MHQAGVFNLEGVDRGREGEKRAKEWLEEQGFKVKWMDKERAPYDLLATKNGVTYAIKVNYGEGVHGVVPRRGTHRFTVSLPVDQVNLIDVCSEALGMSRSAFLQLFLDWESKKMVRFTDEWLKKSQIMATFPRAKEGV